VFLRHILAGRSRLSLGLALHNDRRCDCRSGTEGNLKERFLSHPRISGGDNHLPNGQSTAGLRIVQ